MKYAFSFSMHKAEDQISSLALPLTLHLVKCRMHPENPAYLHWRQECLTWLSQITGYACNVKTPSRKVKATTLTEWLMPFVNDTRIQQDSLVVESKYGPGQSVDPIALQTALHNSIPMFLDGTPVTAIFDILVK